MSEGRRVMVCGRLVWAVGGRKENLFTGSKQTDMNTGAPRLTKSGEQSIQYGFGLAVPVTALQQMGEGQPGEVWKAMHEEAYTMFPNRQIPPSFAMKYKNGDKDVDEKGKPYSMREGYAGHIILACTTNMQIRWYKWENGANVLINDGVKVGDYVNVQLHIKAHPAQGQGKAGLYLSPNAVQLIGFGKEIINTPSGDSVFGNAMPPLPPGASATPTVPSAGFLVPPQMNAPQMPYQPPQPVAPQPVMPNWNVVPQNFQPQGQPAMPQPGNGFPQIPTPAPTGFPQYPGLPTV